MKIFRGLIAWLSIITMALITTKAVRITKMRVPENSFYGESTELTCDYKVESGEKLMYVKWYKDQKEFYVYDPNDSPDDMSLRLPGINVDLSKSGENVKPRRNDIWLLDLNTNSNGNYTCEVSVRHKKVPINASYTGQLTVSERKDSTVDNGLPDLCKNATIDAIFTTADKSTYVFQGLYYWKLNEDGLEEDYPRKIADDWDGLPGNIDAAYGSTRCNTLIFKGSKFWLYRNQIMDKDYPQDIRVGYRNKVLPYNVDAAFTWGDPREVFFLKGDVYYRYVWKFWDIKETDHYPRRIDYYENGSGWRGIPNNIDAVLSRKKMTYFFKGNYYYRYDNDKDEVAVKEPLSTAVNIFGCLGKKITPEL